MAIKVKPTLGELQKLIERLEQKRRVHDLSARVVLDLQSLEDQQADIEKCAKNNARLFEYLR